MNQAESKIKVIYSIQCPNENLWLFEDDITCLWHEQWHIEFQHWNSIILHFPLFAHSIFASDISAVQQRVAGCTLWIGCCIFRDLGQLQGAWKPVLYSSQSLTSKRSVCDFTVKTYLDFTQIKSADLGLRNMKESCKVSTCFSCYLEESILHYPGVNDDKVI